MAKVFLFVLFLIASCTIEAQNASLVLTSKLSGEEIVIPVGEKIATLTQTDKFSKGTYTILSDDRILIDNDTLVISELKEVKQRMKATMIAGATIKVLSGIVVVIGVGYAIKARSFTMAFPSMIAALIGGGGMWINSIHCTYQMIEWTVSIRKQVKSE